MQKDKKNKIEIEVFFWESLLFFFAILLGVSTAFKLSDSLKIQNIKASPISIWQFITYFIIGTVLVLIIPLLIKSKPRKGKIFKGLFVFAIFWGGIMTLDVWLGDYFFGSLLALFLIFSLIILWFKKPSVLIHNICVILGIAGVGSVLGLRVEPKIISVLLLVFAVYDFIAVYKTKHMVKMAKEMIEHKAILGLIIPKRRADFRGELKEIKAGGKFLVLGGGDIVFPLLLCVSVIPDIFSSFFIALFSVIGLFFSYFIFFKQKEQKPIPALPPIAVFSVLGYLITLII
jgi:presenilin-like A22 family membrane protease